MSYYTVPVPSLLHSESHFAGSLSFCLLSIDGKYAINMQHDHELSKTLTPTRSTGISHSQELAEADCEEGSPVENGNEQVVRSENENFQMLRADSLCSS